MNFTTDMIAGKTTALRIALSLYGTMEENINSQKMSASSLLLQTGLGTLPIGMQFIFDSCDMHVWCVDFVLFW